MKKPIPFYVQEKEKVFVWTENKKLWKNYLRGVVLGDQLERTGMMAIMSIFKCFYKLFSVFLLLFFTSPSSQH